MAKVLWVSIRGHLCRIMEDGKVIEEHVITENMEPVDVLHVVKRVRMAYEMPDQFNALDHALHQAERAKEIEDGNLLRR